VPDWDWDRVVFDHVKLTVGDPEASKAFYRTVLAALEIPPLWEGERGGQYANLVVVGPGEASTPIHIGFVARTREEVDAFHQRGSRRAIATTVRRECAIGIAPRAPASTTPRFCSIPTATTSKPSTAATSRLRPS
jgi:glyoxalase/bleomycin resistance protein/dioxygenase superfamily protein